MKFLVFSDLHLHTHKGNSVLTESGQNSRFEEGLNVLERIFELAKSKQASILFAGDFFHTRLAVPTEVLVGAKRLFSRYSPIAFDGIPGNHDQPTNTHSISSLELLEESGLSPTWIHKKAQSWGVNSEVRLAFLPYMTDVDERRRQVQYLSSDNPSTYNILVIHSGIKEAPVGPSDMIIEAGALSKDDFKGFNLVVAGHYHSSQILYSSDQKTTILIPGSPMQLSFGERGERKGVYLIDTDTRSIEFITISSPEHHLVTITNLVDLEERMEGIPRDTYTRVICKSDQISCEDIKRIVGIHVEEGRYQVEYDVDKTHKVRLGIQNSDSMGTILDKFSTHMVQQNRIEEKDKARLLKLGQGYLEKVQEG